MARLARARGRVVDAPPQAVDPSPVAAESPPAEKPRESLTDWLTPLAPDAVIGAAKWTIRRAGREPYEPDPTWEQRWRESYDQALGQYLPRLEMSPGASLVVATVFLWLSMWIGAPKLKAATGEQEEGKEGGESAPAKSTEEAQACQTSAKVLSLADSLPFAGDFGAPETNTDPPKSSPRAETSADHGGVNNAEPVA